MPVIVTWPPTPAPERGAVMLTTPPGKSSSRTGVMRGTGLGIWIGGTRPGTGVSWMAGVGGSVGTGVGKQQVAVGGKSVLGWVAAQSL